MIPSTLADLVVCAAVYEGDNKGQYEVMHCSWVYFFLVALSGAWPSFGAGVSLIA